jgi:hypothetical protein
MPIRKRIINILLLFVGSIINIHANGTMETPGEIEVQEILRFRELEEQYNIKVAPINFPGSGVYDFVYINPDTIIIISAFQMIEIKLSTGEKKLIDPPEVWEEIYYRRFREPFYDQSNNTLHTRFTVNGRGINRSSYYILHLDSYTWELIDELGNDFSFYWYDAENMLINISTFKTVTVYDLSKHEILDSIELPQRDNPGSIETQLVSYIYSMYGNPLKIFATAPGDRNGSRFHYIIFDTATRTTMHFLETTESTIDSKINFSALGPFTPINDDGRFLAVNNMRADKSGIVLVDFRSNTMETVLLDDFPHHIYNFKQIDEGKYGFMMATRNSFGGHGPSFLCFLDYP